MTILYDSIPSAISNFKMAMLIGLHLSGHTTVFLRIKESLQMFHFGSTLQEEEVAYVTNLLYRNRSGFHTFDGSTFKALMPPNWELFHLKNGLFQA